MARTEIDGDKILDGSIQKKDIDITTSGQSVITSFAVSGSGFEYDFTGADNGTGDVTLSLAAGGFGGDFYSAFDETESTTTSNNWVVKLSASTPALTASGKYVLIYTMEMGQTKASKSVGSRVRYRINGGTWVTVTDIQDGIARANAYQLRTGFVIIPDVDTGDIIEAEIAYGQTDETGTGKIKNAGFISWRVSDE